MSKKKKIYKLPHLRENSVCVRKVCDLKQIKFIVLWVSCQTCKKINKNIWFLCICHHLTEIITYLEKEGEKFKFHWKISPSSQDYEVNLKFCMYIVATKHHNIYIFLNRLKYKSVISIKEYW